MTYRRSQALRGTSGGQIYIDGFTGGQLPPKSSIREIRVNQNPFSAQYDRWATGASRSSPSLERISCTVRSVPGATIRHLTQKTLIRTALSQLLLSLT